MAIGITKTNVIGWGLTVALSVAAAYGTINARVYEVEKKIELLQMQITEDGKKIDQQAEDMKEVRDMFNRIDKNLIELKGVVNQKQDRYEKTSAVY
jgi:enoyl-[acyl-carrier-protein] reductase (NADH)